MDLLLSHAQGMLRIAVSSLSCNCRPFETEKSKSPARRDESAQGANRPPLVRQCEKVDGPRMKLSLCIRLDAKPEVLYA